MRRIGPGPERSESRAFSFSGMQKHNYFVNMVSPASRWFLVQFNIQFIGQNCRFEDIFWREDEEVHQLCEVWIQQTFHFHDQLFPLRLELLLFGVLMF